MFVPPISRRNPSEITRLSFGQQRLWFLDQLDPGKPTYHMRSAYRINGNIDIPILELCFSELVRRHESLRTHFEIVNGEPAQIISDPFSVQIEMVDLRNVSAIEGESKALSLIGEECSESLDLSTVPLFRVKVYVARDRSILFLLMHHIISDGWSKKVLFDELSSLYGTISSRRPTDLPDPELQYGDFAEWQNNCLTGEVLKDDLDFWLHNLEGYTDLELPVDVFGSKIPKYAGADVPLELSNELTRSLKELSSKNGLRIRSESLDIIQNQKSPPEA